MGTVWIEGLFKSTIQPVKIVELTDTTKEETTTKESDLNELNTTSENK